MIVEVTTVGVRDGAKPNQEKDRPWQVGRSGQGPEGEQGCPLLLALLHRHGVQLVLPHGEQGRETLIAAGVSPSPGSPSPAETQTSYLLH